MELVAHWVATYGYLGIFSLLMLGIVGLSVPDETLLAFAGYMVFRGQLHIVPTVAAAFLGSICGITVSYLLGRLTGYFVIEKFGAKLHIKMERVHKVHDWFCRFGRFTLTFGYYVPGVRHLTAYVAGASELEVPGFAAYAYSGAALWTASFIALGYFVGERWQATSESAQHLMLIAGVVIGLLAVGWLLWRKLRKPQQGRPEESSCEPRTRV